MALFSQRKGIKPVQKAIPRENGLRGGSGQKSFGGSMDENEKHMVGLPGLLTLAGFVVVVAGMKAASSILVPLFAAIFIAVLCTPPLFWLQGKGVPKILALILILAAILVVGSLLGVLVGTSLNHFVSSLPQYQERLTTNLSPLLNWLVKKGIVFPKEGIGVAINPESAMRLAGYLLSALSKVLADAFLILLTVVFLLLEAADFPKKLKVALKKPEGSLTTIERFSRSANRYVVIKTLLSFAVGLAIWLWLVILGVDYPILWGTLAFLLNYVPNIGSILATIPATLLAFVQLGVGSAILTAFGFLVIHNILGNIVEPKLMGRGLGLSPLVVFISLVFWGWVLGPVGMVLSVPLTSLIKIGLESSGETRGVAIMLGSDIQK
jgi:predicted PurR-regulated permease PerM